MSSGEQVAEVRGIELEPSAFGREIGSDNEEDGTGCPNLSRLNRLPRHIVSDPRTD
jgi:hypothetical protein